MQMNENYAKLRNYCVSVVPMYPLMSYIIFSGTGNPAEHFDIQNLEERRIFSGYFSIF
jgi:hypothetical protein